jgi:uncharacterized protein (TIGR02145 family)
MSAVILCLENQSETPEIATVTTNAITSITDITSTSGGNVTSDGGSAVTSRGVCWSTSSSPTILNSKTTNSSGTGMFTSALTGLNAETTYYVRAYATNSVGTGYGEELSFTSLEISNIITTIGAQIWTTRNLDITTYRDTTPIPQFIGTNAEWAALKVGRWCYPEGNSANDATYGKLYNWYAVAGILEEESNPPTSQQIANRKILAPSGYHVPTRAEWTTLRNAGNAIIPTGNIGGKIKSTGTIELGTGLWRDPNGGATNLTGFSGLPAGFRFGPNGGIAGHFWPLGRVAQWWSSSEINTNGYYVLVDNTNGLFTVSIPADKSFGFSVRLIKD